MNQSITAGESHAKAKRAISEYAYHGWITIRI